MAASVVPWLGADVEEQAGAFVAVTDRVMGGVSEASLAREQQDGRWVWRLRGRVSLENRGGFAQLATSVDPEQGDWRSYRGLRVHMRGDGGAWWLSVRTPQVSRAWQSWRCPLLTKPGWHHVDLLWRDFKPHRIEEEPDWSAVRRLGVLSVGQAVAVDVSLASVSWLR